MGFPTKVQLIKRQTSEQWYINFPSAVAQAMEFGRGETVEWFIEDKETLVLQRPEAPVRRLKKNLAVTPWRTRRSPRGLPGSLRARAVLGAGPAAPAEPPRCAVAAHRDRAYHDIGEAVG
ncbi:MAG: hypothetical protein COY42_25330 [Armatimonadetes bacterium CG_4_10_14_0_8_um_filter_66_14]|nr:MAG: hypothetical protein COY42_25330 [Armatimonadetes bacterium CG_4_10_14_0_8_um_filter_66_14]